MGDPVTGDAIDGVQLPELVAIPGGYCLGLRGDGAACVDVLRMLFNWRLVLTVANPPHRELIHGWCYYGHGIDPDTGRARTMQSAFLAAVSAAALWDGTGEPTGYDKAAF